MTMLTEVGQYVSDGFAWLNLGSTLFLGQMPDTPDDAVALAQGPNGRPDFTMGASDGEPHLPAFETYRLQVQVRAAGDENSYPTAEAKCWAVYRWLCVSNATLSGVRYIVIDPVAVPAPMEEDKQGRVTFVVNFDVQRVPPSSEGQ